MVTLLSELWRIVQALGTPEDSREGACAPPACARPLTGAAKLLLWACAAVLTGLCLGQLR